MFVDETLACKHIDV